MTTKAKKAAEKNVYLALDVKGNVGWGNSELEAREDLESTFGNGANCIVIVEPHLFETPAEVPTYYARD